MYNYCYVDSLLVGLIYVWLILCSSFQKLLSAPHSSTILCMWEGKVSFCLP